MDELEKAAAAISLHDEDSAPYFNSAHQSQESVNSIEFLKQKKTVSNSVFLCRDRTAPADVADDSDDEPLDADTVDSRFGGYRSSDYASADEGSPYETTDDDDEPGIKAGADDEPGTAPATDVPATAPATDVPATAPATDVPATASATDVPATAPATDVPATASATDVPATAPSTDVATEPKKRGAYKKTPVWILEVLKIFMPYFLNYRKECLVPGTDRLGFGQGQEMFAGFVSANESIVRSIMEQHKIKKEEFDSSVKFIVTRANVRYGDLKNKKAAEKKKAAKAEKSAAK